MILKNSFQNLEFLKLTSLVEIRALSKFEKVELKNQAVLVGLVSPILKGTWT